MHNVPVTAACKTLSHKQSTVFYWQGEVIRSIHSVICCGMNVVLITAAIYKNIKVKLFLSLCSLRIDSYFCLPRGSSFSAQLIAGVWLQHVYIHMCVYNMPANSNQTTCFMVGTVKFGTSLTIYLQEGNLKWKSACNTSMHLLYSGCTKFCPNLWNYSLFVSTSKFQQT